MEHFRTCNIGAKIFLCCTDPLTWEIHLQRCVICTNVMAPPRGRYWCFTLNNYTSDEEKRVQEMVETCEDVTYLCYGKEVGESETPHLQGYLELASKLRLGGVKLLPGLSRAHFEPRKGTQDQAIEYCEKDGEFVEYGTRNTNKRGQRSDLLAVKELIDSGATMAEVASLHFGDFIRYARGFEKYAALHAPRTQREVTVYCLWGAPGTGKTRLVFEREPHLFISSDPTLQWFDGYQGEPAALIDDFRGECSPSFILRLLDRYPVKVPIKGGFAQWIPERIYITSNCAPPFGLHSVAQPLLRRIRHTVELRNPLDFEEGTDVQEINALFDN